MDESIRTTWFVPRLYNIVVQCIKDLRGSQSLPRASPLRADGVLHPTHFLVVLFRPWMEGCGESLQHALGCQVFERRMG